MRTIPTLILILISSLLVLEAQTINKNWLELNPLEYVDNLPKYLAQTKSIGVVISDNRRKEVELANLFHPTFKRSGIDPVSYYHVDELFGNILISEELTKEFIKREIKYIIIMRKVSENYEVIITAFSESDSYIEAGRKAWRMSSPEAGSITRAIYSQAHSLERHNFLISDVPEFNSLEFNIRGQRFEAFKPDLRNETLYIPLFKEAKFDSNLNSHDTLMVEFEKHNRAVAAKNEELKALFSDYPYPHEFIIPGQDEDDMRKKGIWYVLKVLHTDNKDCRSILGYREKNMAVTEYISITMNNGQGNVKRIGADEPVFKFYIKHLPSNSFYMGTKWDADVTWQEALQNHLGLLKAEIGSF